MKLIKNKKATAGEWVMSHIVELVILFALLIFAVFWFTDLGDKILGIIKSR